MDEYIHIYEYIHLYIAMKDSYMQMYILGR